MSLSKSVNQVLLRSNFNSFPSGKGSWNENENYRENGNLINEDQLIDYLQDRLSIWYQNIDNSEDILAIKKELISEKSVKNDRKLKRLFKTLRLVDQNICNVDHLDMANIECLILSLNYIEELDGKCLPKSLQILELYGNIMTNINFVCDQSPESPRLKHLGLGRNKIYTMAPLIESSILHESLLSLDLSWNNLTDLSETVEILSLLNKLKNLLLAGNPISLICVYRAYIIDSIKTLTSLDDKLITADERYAVRAMKSKAETVKSKCDLSITVSSIKHVQPKEITKDPSEEPLIKIDYLLSFKFPFSSTEMLQIEEKTQNETETTDTPNEIIKIEDSLHEAIHEIRSKPIQILHNELNFNWTNEIPITDTLILANTIKEPIKFELLEETKYFYSPENLPKPEEESSKHASRINSRGSAKKKAPKSASSKKQPAKDGKKTAAGGDKKKKMDESKMVHHKTDVEVIGVYMCDLSDLLSADKVKLDLHISDDLFKEEVHTKDNNQVFSDKKDTDRSNKSKKSQKEPRGKSAEKGGGNKATKANRKTPSQSQDEGVKMVASECSINVALLSYPTTKALNKVL